VPLRATEPLGGLKVPIPRTWGEVCLPRTNCQQGEDMDAINELLDKCAIATKASNDAALCRVLRVKKQTISNWRKGHRYPDAIACAKIAEVLGVPVTQVIGAVGEARAVTREEKNVWKMVKAAAAFGAALVLMGGSMRAMASPIGDGLTSHNVYPRKGRRRHRRPARKIVRPAITAC